MKSLKTDTPKIPLYFIDKLATLMGKKTPGISLQNLLKEPYLQFIPKIRHFIIYFFEAALHCCIFDT